MSRPNLPTRWSTLSLVATCSCLGALGYLLGGRGFSKISPAATAAPPALSPNSPSSLSPATPPAQPVTPVLAPLSGAAWENRWRELSGQPGAPSRDRELAAMLEELARTDPQRALELARANTNWRLRDNLRDAALRGWASVAPDAAGDWALTVRIEDRRAAVAAVLSGAANHPDEAVRVALRLCKTDPEPAGDYGHAAIASLVEAGAFESAIKFGMEVGSDKYPFLVKSAFYQWAQLQPDKAFAALEGISDLGLRSQAYGQVLFGWARADAKGLAEYALTLPTGEGRNQALTEALPHWVEKDPTSAMDWIRRHDSGPDFDAGVAAIANLQSIVTQQPATAMAMADKLITNPETRSQTMRNVFRQWAETDPAAARGFLERTPEGPDRTTLLNELRDLSPDG